MLLTTEKITYPSTDGINTICGFAVYPENPKMIVQIAHGIAEHSARYLDFARALAERGIAVFAEDHLGHGETANAKEKLGWFAEKDGWQTVINDILTLKSIAKERLSEEAKEFFKGKYFYKVFFDFVNAAESIINTENINTKASLEILKRVSSDLKFLYFVFLFNCQSSFRLSGKELKILKLLKLFALTVYFS